MIPLSIGLREKYQTYGPEWTTRRLTEALELGREEKRQHGRVKEGLSPDQFSVRELAEAFCGQDWVEKLHEGNLNRRMNLLEAGGGDAIDVTAFSNITGQILYNKILDGWEQAGMIGEQLTTNVGTKLSGEKVPWLGRIKDEGQIVHEGMPYPETSFGEHWITTPITTKRGQIISISKEAIYFDRTGQMMRQAGEVGERLRYNKEKRILDCVLGTTNTFSWDGVTYNTYQTAGTFWTNFITELPLVDFTSIQRVEIIAEQILDPDTGNPININFGASEVLVPKALLHTVKQTIHATEIRRNNMTPAPNVQSLSANTLDQYTFLSSPFVYQRLLAQGLTPAQANATWFMGQWKKAFSYYENWPVTVVQAPPQNIAEFERDIVLRYKCSERGTPVVEDPRYVFRINGY